VLCGNYAGIAGQIVDPNTDVRYLDVALARLSSGTTVTVNAENEMRFILLAGRPINEPIVQYGPFVMTSRDEIEQAFADHRDGSLVRKRAAWVSD
jgi:redox-sensitive bicupin YhaK (pirin superfamily)